MDEMVVADLHFSDDVVRKLNRPQFNNVQEMDDYLVKKWNKVVSKESVVWVLGDVGTKKGCSNVKRLNGHKKLIVGNHDEEMFMDKNGRVDKEALIKFYTEMGFEEIHFYPVYYNENVVLSHEPQLINSEYTINIHGHTHKNKINLQGYYNVSCDAILLGPVRLQNYTRFAESKKKIRKSFGKEWYFEHYQYA